MSHTDPEIEKSFVRSKHRPRVLMMLSSLSEAYTGQLARACNLEDRIVRWVMLGHRVAYNPDLSLVPLGLAVEVTDANGRKWCITPKGRRWARKLAARRERHDRQRAAVRQSNLEFFAARDRLAAGDVSPAAAIRVR